MDAVEYNMLRKRIEDRHSERQREIDNERDSDIAALHRVCEIAGFSPGPSSSSTSSSGSSSSTSTSSSSANLSSDNLELDHGGRGVLTSIITKAVGFIGDYGFTFHDVKDALHDWRPDLDGEIMPNAITQVLRRMVELGQLEVEEQGQGRRATSYVKTSKFPTKE